MYKILYHFENEMIDIIEIKKGCTIDKDKSNNYFWLLYDKKNDMISRLEFRSMKSLEKEYRIFDDSELCFNKQTGIYKKGAEEQVVRIISSDMPLSVKLNEAVSDFLLMLTFN